MAVLLFMSLTVKVSTLTTTCECTFSLYYRILIQGGKTHPLIFIVGTNNFIEYLQSYQILIFIYYKFYSIILFIIINNTVYSVCCRYTSCNLKQKQGSNCLLSIRRKWFLFIHIVKFLKETQTFWKKPNWTSLLHEFFSLPSSLHEFFFLGIFPCMNFFGFFPAPITFLMARPLSWNGARLKN